MIEVPTITMKDELANVAAANKIEPITSEFDETKGVAGRVNAITSSGSPLMETVRTRAAQNSARRGLRNSSIGVQAGEQAVIETAVPIAQADANLYQQQRLTNQTAQNNAATVNASNAIQSATTGRQMDLQDGQQRKSLMEQARQFDASTAQRETLARIDVDSRRELANIEAQFKNSIQNNTNISQAWGTMMDTIKGIQNNAELLPEAKQRLIQNNLDAFKTFSSFWQKASGGTVDVSDLLNFGMTNAGGAPAGSGSNTGNAGSGAPPVDYIPSGGNMESA